MKKTGKSLAYSERDYGTFYQLKPWLDRTARPEIPRQRITRQGNCAGTGVRILSMTSELSARAERRESFRAFSIIFFCAAFLCLLLGGAQGVRHDTKYLHIPESGGWLVAVAVFAAVGAIFFLFSRGAKSP